MKSALDMTLSGFLQKRFGGNLGPPATFYYEGSFGIQGEVYGDCVRLQLPYPVEMRHVDTALYEYCKSVGWFYYGANVSEFELTATVDQDDALITEAHAFMENPLNSLVLCVLIRPRAE